MELGDAEGLLSEYRRRIELFQRIDGFDARPRERIVARGEVFAILYPEFFNIELLHFTECVRDRVSSAPRDQMRELHGIEQEASLRIIQDAVACGDLELPSAIAPEEVAYTLGMLMAGVLGSVGLSVPVADIGIAQPEVGVLADEVLVDVATLDNVIGDIVENREVRLRLEHHGNVGKLEASVLEGG